MKKYQTYTKDSFEFMLRKLAIEKRLGFLSRIDTKNQTWEYVYKLTTRNKAVDIIVFSSVDIRSNKTREKGSDCVRLVMRWKTKNGNLFKSLGKHYRLQTLFQNMEKTLSEAQNNCFNLNGKEFCKEMNQKISA